MEPIRLKLVKGNQEAELLAQGWTKQTTIGEPRLSEIAANYRGMGYEVHVVEHPADASGESCDSCFAAGAALGEMCGDVYIRRGGNTKPLEDELF